jgi:hypothetical protein
MISVLRVGSLCTMAWSIASRSNFRILCCTVPLWTSCGPVGSLQTHCDPGPRGQNQTVQRLLLGPSNIDCIPVVQYQRFVAATAFLVVTGERFSHCLFASSRQL